MDTNIIEKEIEKRKSLVYQQAIKKKEVLISHKHEVPKATNSNNEAKLIQPMSLEVKCVDVTSCSRVMPFILDTYDLTFPFDQTNLSCEEVNMQKEERFSYTEVDNYNITNETSSIDFGSNFLLGSHDEENQTIAYFLLFLSLFEYAN